jgi:hypothetical protein
VVVVMVLCMNQIPFFIGKQKVVLFPKYRENGWESAASTLSRVDNFVFVYWVWIVSEHIYKII